MKSRLYVKGFMKLFLAVLFLMPTMAHADSAFVTILRSLTENACWFCGMFDGLFDSLNEIITLVCDRMQGTFLALLGLGLAFYLAFRVGRAMFSITGEADTKLVPELFVQSIKVGLAAIMIMFYLGFFDAVISPLLRLSISLGNEMTLTQLEGYTQQAAREANSAARKVVFSEENICKAMKDALNEEAAQGGRPEGDKNAFTKGTKEAFLCYVRTGSVAMMTGIAIGATLITQWFNLGIWGMFSHCQLLGVGLELIIVFFILFIMFPLQLLDPIVKLGFVCALMPLWLTLWAFKATSKYATDKAWNMFVNVLANLIIISVLAVIVISMMNQALGDSEHRRMLFQALINGTADASFFEEQEGLGIVGKSTLFTAALGYLAIKLFGQNEELAKQFADGVSLGLSSSATALAAKGGGAAIKGARALDQAGVKALEGAAAGDGVGAKWAKAALGTRRGVAALAMGGWTGGAAALAGHSVNKFRHNPNRTDSGSLLSATKLASSRAARSKWLKFLGLSKFAKDAKGGTINGQIAEFNNDTKKFSVNKANGGAAIYDHATNSYTLRDRNGNVQSTYDNGHDRLKLNNRDFSFSDVDVTTGRGVVSSGSEVYDQRTDHYSVNEGQNRFIVTRDASTGRDVIQKFGFNSATNAYDIAMVATHDEEETMRNRRNSMESDARQAMGRRAEARSDIEAARRVIPTLYSGATWP